MLKQNSRPGKGFGIFTEEGTNHDRSTPCSEKKIWWTEEARGMARSNYNACCGNNTIGYSHAPTVLDKSCEVANSVIKLLVRSRWRVHSPLLKKGLRQGKSELQTRIMKLILQESRQPKASGEPGASASDQGSTSPVLEHHLVTKNQKKFLQIPYCLLRKYIVSVTQMPLRCLNTDLSNTEHPCSSGCLAGDVTKKSHRKAAQTVGKTNTCF